jgi:protein TonB
MKPHLLALAALAFCGVASAQQPGSPNPAASASGSAPAVVYGPDTPGIQRPKPHVRHIQMFLQDSYPAASVKAREEGIVFVEMCVSANGKVSEIKLLESSGYPRLDEAVIRELPTIRFYPAKLDGAEAAYCGYPFKLQWNVPDLPASPPPTPQ